ncbi:hypothetical protein [Pontixanthobacter gangjinensis]|uniref:Uncharacterized protein n=1 Tax=Pontixanthobacter gangjinensis TaxID=1028742 RepID=A0A6I4SQ06_9SPHN|nr:hypothetical protein [Pontixanthobacter gangjinensis]MXO56692.1 hypothetical protein [Pontixanthobacter gangjinensis]
MNAMPAMPCPNCSETIALDPKALLAGKQIECGSCNTAIGLQESSANLVGDTLSKMDSVRQAIGKAR